MTIHWRLGLWLLVVVAALGFLWLVRGVLPPFALAILFSVVLEPVVRWMVRKGVPRPVGVFAITVAFFGLLGTGLVLLAPRVVDQVNEAGQRVQLISEQWNEQAVNDNMLVRWNPIVRSQGPGPLATVDSLLEQARPVLDSLGVPSSRPLLIEQYVTPHRAEMAQSVQKFLNGLVGSLTGAFSTLAMLSFTPLLVIMMLIDLDRLSATALNWIPPSLRSGTQGIATDVVGVFQRYLQGMLINISLYAFILAIVLTIFQVPYAILLALMAGIFYMVPILGGWMSCIVICTVALLTGTTHGLFFAFPNPYLYSAGLFFAFFCVTLTWDMLISPRVVGSAVDLHPLVSMFVVFCGGALFGLPGMVLAYPVAGIVKVTLARLMNVTNAPTEELRLPAIPPRHRPEPEVT